MPTTTKREVQRAGARLVIGYRLRIACLAVLLAGCSALPRHARPVLLEDPDYLRKEDVIEYRRLTRADFRGVEPPPGFDHRMAAAICAYIEPQPEQETAQVEYLGEESGKHVYTVTYRNPILRAKMDRDCSWWNADSSDALPETYILEHEQIHFALFEIAARELSGAIDETSFRFRGADAEELKQDLQSQVKEYLRREVDDFMERQLVFDEQTSAVFDPERQREWHAMVREELGTESFDTVGVPAIACSPDDDTRAALANARRVLRNSNYRPSMLELLEEAQAAAGPPECDAVRARILADKILQIAEDPVSTPCRVDARTRRALDDAIASAAESSQTARAQQLIRQARAALEPPECDNVRARILADKINEASRVPGAGQ